MGLLHNFVLRVALVGLVFQRSCSHAYPQPDPTAHKLQLREANPAPRPTPPPPLHQVIKRQADGTKVEVWMASSNTCGYLSGAAGAALTCGGQATCNIVPDAPGFGLVMCCDFVECQLHLDCLDQTIAENTKSCNDVCQLDEFTKKWTVAYPNGVLDFMCFPSPGPDSIANAAFTYAGQAIGGDFITTTVTLPGDDTRLTSSRKFILSNAPTTSSSTSTSNTPSPPGDASSSDEKKNVGAIVGGTVGGIAAIGLVGLGAWFLVLRSRERKESTYQHSMYQPSMSQQPTPHSPTTTVGGYMAAQEQLDRRENFQTQTQPQLYHQHT